MKIALAQINTTVGDLENNVARCADAAAEAAALGADLVVLPEMALPGPAPRDILYDDSFIEANEAAAADLAARVQPDRTVVVGGIARAPSNRPCHPGLLNAALVLQGGRVVRAVGKRCLPLYYGFYEPRWFLPGQEHETLSIAGNRVGFLVGEDLTFDGGEPSPPRRLVAAGADLLVCSAAFPFSVGAPDRRLRRARRTLVPTACVNACGATDELVYDGGSFLLDPGGRVVASLRHCEEEIRIVDLENQPDSSPPAALAETDLLRAVLVLGIRDFADKNHLGTAFVGLSGGVDQKQISFPAVINFGLLILYGHMFFKAL